MATTEPTSDRRQRRAIMLLLTGWTFALLGAAYFAVSANTSPNTEPNHVTGRSLEEAMPVFKQAQRSLSPEVRGLERSFGSAESGPFAEVDFSRAQPVEIQNSTATAWIAPAGDHVCAFIPDPVDGYGAGCVTVTDIELGRGFSLLHDDVQAYVLIYVLAGDEPPSIATQRGSELLKTTVNAVAVHTSTDSTIKSAHGEIDLQSLRKGFREDGH